MTNPKSPEEIAARIFYESRNEPFGYGVPGAIKLLAEELSAYARQFAAEEFEKMAKEWWPEEYRKFGRQKAIDSCALMLEQRAKELREQGEKPRWFKARRSSVKNQNESAKEIARRIVFTPQSGPTWTPSVLESDIEQALLAAHQAGIDEAKQEIREKYTLAHMEIEIKRARREAFLEAASFVGDYWDWDAGAAKSHTTYTLKAIAQRLREKAEENGGK